MARTYRRDARGRFAGAGYSGQTSGRGTRLKAGGNVRAGGGTRIKAAGPRGTVRKSAGLRPGAIKPKRKAAKTGPSSRDVRVDNKLKELAKVSPGVSKVITEGLRPFTPKNVNGVVVAARLERMNKEGRLSGLDGRQMRRVQNVFNRGKFTASVAPQSYARQESIRLAVKNLSERFDGGNPVAKVKPARSSAAKPSKPAQASKPSAKLDPMQRSESAYQKRKYGVHSTISNPGRPSRRAPRRTSATGSRVAVRGSSAATKKAYRSRVSTTLNQTRQGSIGMGRVRRNPRMVKQQTGMTQLSLTGRAKPLTRFRMV